MVNKFSAKRIAVGLTLSVLVLVIMSAWSTTSQKDKGVGVKVNTDWSFPIYKDSEGLYVYGGGSSEKMRLPSINVDETMVYAYSNEYLGDVGPYLLKDNKTALIVDNSYPYNRMEDISGQIKDVKNLKKLDNGAYDNHNIYTDGIDFYEMYYSSYWKRMSLENGKLLDHSFFIKDDKTVFYLNKEIKYADAKTFDIVKSDIKGKQDPSEIKYSYAKDKNRVYFKYSPVNNADPETFKVYGSNYYQQYAHDKDRVYFEGKLIPWADPETFKVLREQPYEGCSIDNYGLDKNYVYFETDIVKGANPKTFEGMWNGFGRDDKNSYYRGMKIDGDPKNLKNECSYG